MTIHYNMTGEERKRLVQAISDILGCPAKYLGAPGFAFRIDTVTVSRNGDVSLEDDGGMAALVNALAQRGFHLPLTAESAMEKTSPPETETAAGDNPADAVADNGVEAAQESAESNAFSLCVSVSREGISDAALENLRRLVGSKAGLIRKALNADSLDIVVTGERISFPWFRRDLKTDETASYTRFIQRLVETAKAQKRVNAREKVVDNEKFTFRVFLLRLGFVGREYKRDRKILLRNLTGHTAFRTAAYAEKAARKRREKRDAESSEN